MSPRGTAPEWWPDGEAWPPRGWARQRSGGGPWEGHGRRGRWRPFGCMVLLLGLFVAGAIFMALWALGAIAGAVEAPPLVTGFGVVAFALVVIGGIAVTVALRRMTRPLDELIEMSGRIEAGDYSARVEVGGGGGVRSLTRAFNGMSERLQASDERRRAYLAEVTHELRTPLTVISGQLEAIEDGVYVADPERIAALLAQTRQMSALIEDLHTLSLAEVGALRVRLVAGDLAALADGVVATFAPAAQEVGIDLRVVAAQRPVMAAYDDAATRRVLANLITNAVRHTPSDGVISITVRPTTSGADIEVADTGSGMDDDLTATAFERFAKGPDSDGSGLGLAIASDLMHAQGGQIELHSTPGAGTQVRLAFGAPEED